MQMIDSFQRLFPKQILLLKTEIVHCFGVLAPKSFLLALWCSEKFEEELWCFSTENFGKSYLRKDTLRHGVITYNKG